MNESPEKKNEKPGLLLASHRKTVESTKGMSPAILLGSSFAAAMGIFSWIGHSWDEKHGSEPWGVLGGVTLGLLYGVYEVWKLTRSPAESSASSPKGESKASQGTDKGE
ncbi:AtpZ/AtpI family protein [Kiritimatiellota bacterium B12222]|nr:AtpZ/AtpI family protein [Kiritimatiellota bacterium B12222]